MKLPPRPPQLAGREGLLTDLHDRLNRDEASGPRVVALHGVGGAGKTSVAVEYAHRHQAEVGLAWLLAAGDPTGLPAEFGRLATQLGAASGFLDARDPVFSVHGVLADFPLPWLLIFDNVSNAEEIHGFLPPAGNGLVLITSQHGTWPNGKGILVPPLNVDVAAEFLVNCTGDPDDASARAIAEDLGGLPLALAQATAYIAMKRLSLAGYQGLWVKYRDDLLTRGPTPDHPVNVAATLGMALSQLEDSSPAAAGLLRVLAFLASEPVPLELLLGDASLAPMLDPEVGGVLWPMLGRPLAIGDAVEALHRYSLLTPADSGMEVVHRLVQTIIRRQMPAEIASAWQRGVEILLNAAIPADPENPATWSVFAILLPHVQVGMPDESGGKALVADYLGRSGNYLAACDLCRSIFQAREREYGATDARTLKSRAALAIWTGEAGDPGTACDLLAALLQDRTGLSGPEDEDTLSDRYQLASFTGRAGDIVQARDMFAALMPVHESVLGHDHRYTLATKHQLATYTGRTGQAAAARALFAELLQIRESVLGPEHPHTLSTRHQLASFTGEAGDVAAAKELFAELLPDRERVLGKEHPDTLATLSNLAAYTAYAGEPSDAAQARDLFEKLLGIRERILGTAHPDTLTTLHQFATFTGRAGAAREARDLFAELVIAREAVSGARHPDTLATRHQLAAFTGRAGDAIGARDLFAELLPIREEVLGKNHPDTQATRNNLHRWEIEVNRRWA